MDHSLNGRSCGATYADGAVDMKFVIGYAVLMMGLTLLFFRGATRKPTPGYYICHTRGCVAEADYFFPGYSTQDGDPHWLCTEHAQPDMPIPTGEWNA